MINTDEFALKGRHNLLNAMAAITVSDLLKIDNDIIRESLLTFSGLPHRLEKFLKIQGVNYINDLKLQMLMLHIMHLIQCELLQFGLLGSR